MMKTNLTQKIKLKTRTKVVHISKNKRNYLKTTGFTNYLKLYINTSLYPWVHGFLAMSLPLPLT